MASIERLEIMLRDIQKELEELKRDQIRKLPSPSPEDQILALFRDWLNSSSSCCDAKSQITKILDEVKAPLIDRIKHPHRY